MKASPSETIWWQVCSLTMGSIERTEDEDTEED